MSNRSSTLIILSVVRNVLVPLLILPDSLPFMSGRSVVSPGKCVLLSTSKSVRKAKKLWGISGDGSFWKVQLDVRSFSSNGLDIGCSMNRLLGLTCVLVVLLIFPLCLYQRKLKFDMFVSTLVPWLELWPSSLVEMVGSCHVVLALTCPG